MEVEIATRSDEPTWMVEAAGIEPYAALFEKRLRRAIFVVKLGKGNELQANSLSSPVPWSPHQSSPVVERSWKAASQVSRRRRTTARSVSSIKALIREESPKAEVARQLGIDRK